MQHVIFHTLGFLILTILILSPSSDVAWGNTNTSDNEPDTDLTVVMSTDPDQQPFIEEAQQQLQQARELLKELNLLRDRSSGEKNHELTASIRKLTNELEHAERLFDNLDVIDPEPWLRTKTEVNAGLTDLQVAYNEAFKLLQNRTRSLEEAIRQAQSATDLVKKGHTQLFFNKARAAHYYASLAREQGMSSQVLQKGISKLKDALFHIKQNNVDAAAILTEEAVPHLETALTKQTALE